MPWKPPTKYDPAPDIPDQLIHGSPPVGSALFDIVVYWQWTHYWWHEKSIEEAWNDLRMSPSNARKAIDQRIVPLEIYDRALQRALQRLRVATKGRKASRKRARKSR